MNWKADLLSIVIRRGLTFIRLSPSESVFIHESRRGTNQFSFTRKHSVLQGIKAPSACLFCLKINNSEELYFGIAKSKRAVSTLDSAIKITDSINIQPANPARLLKKITTIRMKNRLRKSFIERYRVPKGQVTSY